MGTSDGDVVANRAASIGHDSAVISGHWLVLEIDNVVKKKKKKKKKKKQKKKKKKKKSPKPGKRILDIANDISHYHHHIYLNNLRLSTLLARSSKNCI